MLPRTAVLTLAIVAAASVGAAEVAKPKVVAFNASVRVEVDAAGKPVKVEAPADLPEAIRGFIEKRVASWQYQPAKANGMPASAVTFVRVGACAIPVAEGYRLGLDFKGNGPALETSGPWFLPPPPYPSAALRGGGEGAFKVSYVIQKDGSTRVASVEAIEGTAGRFVKDFRVGLTSWIEGMRYRPEVVAGMPVETEMSLPVSFSLSQGGGGNWRKQYQQRLEEQALASKECVAAQGVGGPLPIASNSPVKITPAPAG